MPFKFKDILSYFCDSSTKYWCVLFICAPLGILNLSFINLLSMVRDSKTTLHPYNLMHLQFLCVRFFPFYFYFLYVLYFYYYPSSFKPISLLERVLKIYQSYRALQWLIYLIFDLIAIIYLYSTTHKCLASCFKSFRSQ